MVAVKLMTGADDQITCQILVMPAVDRDHLCPGKNGCEASGEFNDDFLARNGVGDLEPPAQISGNTCYGDLCLSGTADAMQKHIALFQRFQALPGCFFLFSG